MQQPVRGRSSFMGLPLPTRPEEIPESWAWFASMREKQPVFRDERLPLPLWQIFRYDDVVAVLKDYTHFSSSAFMMGDSFLADTLVAKDPPEHRKLRNLVNLAFTSKAVAHLSGRIAEITQNLLDEVRAKGEIDIVSDIAFPLPARVIAEMLGVPEEDWDIFQRWVKADSDAPQTEQSTGNFRQEMADFFSNLLEQRRRSPREDLISALSMAEIDGERLSEHELVSFCFLLLAAGQETTKNLIANFFLVMSEQPESHAQLVKQPELVPNAIEELLRYLPPVWFLMRRTITDVEINGVTIPEGHIVLPWLVSADRDPSQFAHPDRFDIRREANRHMTFGHGIHFCVGAPLARLEAKIALPMMLEQLRDLRVVPGAPIDINVGIVFVIASLPMLFRPY